MEEHGMRQPAAMQAAFDQLAERLGDAEFRKDFRSDPSAAGQKHGVDVSAIPAEILEAVGGLTEEQQRYIAEIHPILNVPFPGKERVGIIF